MQTCRTRKKAQAQVQAQEKQQKFYAFSPPMNHLLYYFIRGHAPAERTDEKKESSGFPFSYLLLKCGIHAV
jgi:hypothetical protein